ncbi:MAG: glycosyltransferase [Flammeovirgaceae bacterium]
MFTIAGKLIDQTRNNKIFNRIIKTLFKKADIFLAQGENWKNFAKNSLNIFTNKIQLITNWTATNELLNIGFNKKINNNLNIKILYVGWLEKEKGVNELISAINGLIKKNKSIELILVGDGSIRKKIEKYVTTNKIDSNIKFTGWLNSEKINYHLRECDIFVLPSWQEGMPNALIEAVSSGIPSIASSVGVIPNFFTHLENILLIEPKNITNLQMSIEKLIDDHDLRKKISNNGYIIAKTFFSEDKSLKLLSDIIKKLLNG